MSLVQISQVQGRIPIIVLQIQDQINLENYKELEQAAKDAFDKGMHNLVIDLGQTPSLTSIGIRVLVIIHKMLRPWMAVNMSNWHAHQNPCSRCSKSPGSRNLSRCMTRWKKL